MGQEYGSKDAGRGRTGGADLCRARGSWYDSAQDLAQLARTIEFSNRLIERSTRALLYAPARPNTRLVYWRLYPHGFLGFDTGGQRCRAHGGSSGLGTRSTLMRLPFGCVGVGIANSPEVTSAAMGNVLLDAFYDASRR